MYKVKSLIFVVLFIIWGTSSYGQCEKTYRRTFPCENCAVILEGESKNFAKSTLYDMDNMSFIEVTPNKLDNGALILKLSNPSREAAYSGTLKLKNGSSSNCEIKIIFETQIQNIFKISDESKIINIYASSSDSIFIPIHFENLLNEENQLSDFTLLVKQKGKQTLSKDFDIPNLNINARTKIDVPIFMGQFTSGKYNGVLRFVDKEANKFSTSILFHIKHPYWLSIVILIIGLILGLSFKKISLREIILRNSEKVNKLIELIKERNDDKYLKIIDKLNNLKKLIHLLTQNEFDMRFNKILKEVELLLDNPNGMFSLKNGLFEFEKTINGENDRYLKYKIKVLHFLLSFILSLFFYYNMFIKNDVFGSFWDYLILFSSGVFVSYTSGELLGDRLERIFSKANINKII